MSVLQTASPTPTLALFIVVFRPGEIDPEKQQVRKKNRRSRSVILFIYFFGITLVKKKTKQQKILRISLTVGQPGVLNVAGFLRDPVVDVGPESTSAGVLPIDLQAALRKRVLTGFYI